MTATPAPTAGTTSQPPLLALREVHRTYGHGARANTVLHGIDLEVHPVRAWGSWGNPGPASPPSSRC